MGAQRHLLAWQNAVLLVWILPRGSGIIVEPSEDERENAVDMGSGAAGKTRKKMTKLVWTKTCWGYEGPWSEPCSEQCYQEKRFRLMVDKDCPGNVPLNDSVQVRLCDGGDCTIKRDDPNPMMRALRQAIFDFRFQTEHVDALAEMAESLQLPLQVMILFIVSSVCWVRSFRASWLPDVVIAMPVAAAFALILRFGCFHGLNFGDVMIESLSELITALMNDLLLPITIFVGAFTVDRLNMFAEFGCSLVLAVIGTLSQILLVFVMVRLSGADYLGWHVVDNWREALVYASFIADVDPVITLSIFQKLKVPPLLFTLAGGEGLLNDPIALVLFGMLNVANKDLELSPGMLAYHIMFDLVGSAVVGVAAGVALTKYMNICKVPGKGSLECIYLACSAYFSYALGEFLALSGIIVSLFCGFVMGGLCSHLCADIHGVEEFLENLAVFAEMGMFMIVGFGVFLIRDMQHMTLGLVTIPFCIIARAITMAVLIPPMNVFRKIKHMTLIDAGTSIMLTWCNLRGSIVVMMALEVDSYWSTHQETILGASIIVIIALNYLSGCTIPFAFYMTGVPLGVDFPPGSLYNPDTASSRIFTNTSGKLENFAVWNGHRQSVFEEVLDHRAFVQQDHEIKVQNCPSDNESVGSGLGRGSHSRQVRLSQQRRLEELAGLRAAYAQQQSPPTALSSAPGRPKASTGGIELTEMAITSPPASHASPHARMDREEDQRASVLTDVTEEWNGEAPRDSLATSNSDDESDASPSKHLRRGFS